MNLHCTTASFTVFLEPKGFVVLCQLAPRISAFYGISVRRLTDLPTALLRTFPREFALALG